MRYTVKTTLLQCISPVYSCQQQLFLGECLLACLKHRKSSHGDQAILVLSNGLQFMDLDAGIEPRQHGFHAAIFVAEIANFGQEAGVVHLPALVAAGVILKEVGEDVEGNG